jgi:type IV secretion system protein TrbJ
MNWPRRRVLASALALAIYGRAARAQVTVYDPAAVAQAIKQVSQGLQQIEHLKNQLQQQAQMITKLGVDVTAPLAEIAAQATELLHQAQGLGYGAADLSKAFAQMYPESLVGASAGELAERLAAWSTASRQTLREAMQVQSQIVQTQPVTAGAVQAAIAASQAAAGQTAAVQATNQLLGVLATQLGQLQTLLIAQARQAETFEAEMRGLAAKGRASAHENSTFELRPRVFSKDSLE